MLILRAIDVLLLALGKGPRTTMLRS
jgi:hypothetical protein